VSWQAAVSERGVSAGDDWITVPVASVHEVLEGLKADGFRSWCFLSAVDHLAEPGEPKPGRFELVYQLRNMESGKLIRVRVYLPESDPVAPTVTDLFPPANWDERETYDQFGVIFLQHPDLTRILNPDDWVGHPLRRDYPVGGEPVDFSEDHEAWQTAPREA
jgi:NADH-quinone oxidoreductase subunit C